MTMQNFNIYLAPMLDVTNPSFRKLIRLTSSKTILFTEMIVADTINNISDQQLLSKVGLYDENTIVQIGGSDPEKIAFAVQKIKLLLNFTQFNLNCGCPSSRVKSGCFGAILMLNPNKVVEIINKVFELTNVILSLKIRIGVDDNDTYDFVYNFINTIIQNTKCNTFFIHARKCLLNGLSPSANRTIPKLNYDFVFQLKKDFKNTNIILNGGLNSTETFNFEDKVDGIMIGRAAMNNVLIFSEVENLDRKKIIFEYLNTFEPELIVKGEHLKPISNIFYGFKGTKRFKNKVEELIRKKINVIEISKELKVFFEDKIFMSD